MALTDLKVTIETEAETDEAAKQLFEEFIRWRETPENIKIHDISVAVDNRVFSVEHEDQMMKEFYEKNR